MLPPHILASSKVLITGGSGFIGTNLTEALEKVKIPIANVDYNPPLDSDQEPHWIECNILDGDGLNRIFRAFQPTHVVHLAARIDCEEENDIGLYSQNTVGTKMVLDAVRSTPSVKRVVVTSTQFVCKAGYLPKHDEDFDPYTLYGSSKVETEVLTRSAGLDALWTLIRPTTVWGPWCLRYRDGFFKVLERGLYMHPGGRSAVRSYGYVGNVVYQIISILSADAEVVNGQVFYVGDRPVRLVEWVDAFAKEIKGKTARKVPRAVVRGLGLVGDLLGGVRIPFPIVSSRYRSMIEDYITPIDKTIEVFGESPFTLHDGVRETVKWYREKSRGVPDPGIHLPRLAVSEPRNA